MPTFDASKMPLRATTPLAAMGCETKWIVIAFLAISSFAQAQGFTKLVDFSGSNGAQPYLMSLIQGTDGSLYGTTQFGGTKSEGTIFRITREGSLTRLYSFCSKTHCADGLQPGAGLLLGRDGNLYGTTQQGGTHACQLFQGCGTIFRLTRAGLTTLHSFDGADGSLPGSVLTEGTDGRFYGTSVQGGTGPSCSFGCGTVFKMTAAGKLTSLHSFDYDVDGARPYAGLAEGVDGNFYGAVTSGGEGGRIQGTVFKISSEGAFETLISFGVLDGALPYATMTQGLDGNFYGTTYSGGTKNCFKGCGSVYQTTPTGALTILHKFDLDDGGGPSAPVVLATDGNFYGTTYYGGDLTCDAPYGCGTVFRMTPDGTVTTLHTFSGSDGASPAGGLIQATNGDFYGTTWQGGKRNQGTVFRISAGLQPFVSLVSTAGKVGQSGGILGQGFTGTTSVSINGTPASFTVVSGTLIRATIPAGATSGFVTVTTPGGTLTSNVPLRVLP